MESLNIGNEIVSVKDTMDMYNKMIEYVNEEDINYQKLIKNVFGNAPVISIAYNIQIMSPLLKYIFCNPNWSNKIGCTRILREAMSMRDILKNNDSDMVIDVIRPDLKNYPDPLNNVLSYEDTKPYYNFLKIVKDIGFVKTNNYYYNAKYISMLENVVSCAPILRTEDGVPTPVYSNMNYLTTEEAYYYIWMDLNSCSKIYFDSTFGEYTEGQGYYTLDTIRDMLNNM